MASSVLTPILVNKSETPIMQNHLICPKFFAFEKSTFTVNPFAQLPRTFKSDHPPGLEHHVVTGCRISSPTLPFVLDAKFTEFADQNIFAGFKDFIHDFKKGFNRFTGLFLCKSEMV